MITAFAVIYPGIALGACNRISTLAMSPRLATVEGGCAMGAARQLLPAFTFRTFATFLPYTLTVFRQESSQIHSCVSSRIILVDPFTLVVRWRVNFSRWLARVSSSRTDGVVLTLSSHAPLSRVVSYHNMSQFNPQVHSIYAYGLLPRSETPITSDMVAFPLIDPRHSTSQPNGISCTSTKLVPRKGYTDTWFDEMNDLLASRKLSAVSIFK